MALKLYVGGLAYAVSEDQLKDMFAEFGVVETAIIIKDRDSGQSKGFGFVEMAEKADAEKAIAEMNGKDIDGRSLTVNEARPKEDRPRNNDGGSFRKSY